MPMIKHPKLMKTWLKQPHTSKTWNRRSGTGLERETGSREKVLNLSLPSLMTANRAEA
ncbi:hypothetical protein GCM10027189_11840 [Rufibacter soli]